MLYHFPFQTDGVWPFKKTEITGIGQIRPSIFGGSFNQPNVPTINVVVDMVAPNAGLPR